ncbi:TetR/AcrR family transcriptional regulator [Bordetella sp. BOR01]|uniref:TetR/AcrR family transcriptional regulator n=1 Tax=Bordetella sp. BOR01 TaxID=2854779 RepID=UPI001C45BEA4|nr:TetR/AcrR family transcriptional regulator [Bordetella sp. BOR01]MBV7481876.1 TetR/AcrR family transcriptional regulator [Bordetella sp. BOR01]
MESSSTPATATRAQRLTALRRQLILDAAQRVFQRDGLEKTTVRAIAKEAGCTTGAIYPWFGGKEAIYAELLEASLERLHGQLERALDGRPAGAARRVIEAFFQYYAGRATEFSLGMYLFQGLGPRGLGRDVDDRLNVRLRDCVDQLGRGLRAAKQWSDDTVAAEQMQAFTYLMGLLLLFHTRRLKSLGQRADELLERFCTTLEHR